MNCLLMNQPLIQAVKSLNWDRAHMLSKLVEANYPQDFIQEVMNLYKPLGREGMFDDSVMCRDELMALTNNNHADQVGLYEGIKKEHYTGMEPA